MSFVYPLLLGGLLLAGIPVLLHFIVRRQPKTLVFPAFRFLVQKRRSNTRSLRLKHLLLLLFRIALIVLICLALARPRLFREEFGWSREKPAALVLIFDTSPSMGYKFGDMARLDLAKQRGLELLDQLPEDGRVLILDTGELTGFAREEWLRSPDKARQRIQNLIIRPGSVPVTKALDEGLRRFEDWDRAGDDPAGQALPRFVCVFGDRTRASWEPNASKRPAKDGATPGKMLYIDVGIDDPIDLAIVQADLPAGRHSFAQGEKVPLRVLVRATAASKTDSNAVLVVMDGKPVAQQSFNPEPGKASTLTLDIETANLSVGLHDADVKLATAGDALAFNDVRHVTFGVHQKQKILVLSDSPARTRRFADGLAALLYAVDQKTPRDKVAINGFAAVFVVSVAAPTDAMWASLMEYVMQGGGVAIIPPGDELVRDSYNSPAARQVMPAHVGARIDSAGARWDIAKMDLRHSFLSLYGRWLAEDWDFIRYPRMASSYWSMKPIDEKNVIVYYDDGRPAVFGRGKVLLLTTPLDQRELPWNDYAQTLTSFQLALTLMCARYLCPEPGEAGLNFQFGAPPPVVAKPALAFPKYLLSSGDFSEEIRFDNGKWIGERLPRAGNYTIAGTNPDRQETTPLFKFSINEPGAESDLTRVPIDEIQTVMGTDAVVPQDRHTSLRESLAWDEPMELFPWLMIGVLLLLAVENLLANKFYKLEPAPADA